MELSRASAPAQYALSIRFLAPAFLLVGLVGLAFSTIVQNPYTITYPSALLAGTGVFLLLRRNEAVSLPRGTSQQVKLVGILYVWTAIALVGSYYLAGFQRTLPVFGLTFTLYILTAVVCVLKPSPVLGLGLLSVSGLFNRLTAYYTSSLYTGVDVFGHIAHVQGIIASGSLAPLANDKYLYAPVYHLSVAMSQLVVGTPLRDANALVVTTVVTVVPVLVVYLLVRRFWGVRVALVGGLLYVSSDFAIEWGIRTIPTSVGIVFYGLALVVLLRYLVDERKKDLVLLGLLFASLTLTHQLSLVITTVMIATVAGVKTFYTGRLHRQSRNVVLLAGTAVFMDFTVTRYTGTNESFFDIVLNIFIIRALEAGFATRSDFTLPDDPAIFPTGAGALSLPLVAGSGVLLALGITGALFWLDSQQRPLARFFGVALGGITGIGLVIALAGPVVGFRNLLPFRWFAYIYIPLAALAGPGLFYLAQRIRSHGTTASVVALCLLIGLCGGYVVLMGATASAGPDGALFSDAPGAERLNVQADERALYEHTAEYSGAEGTVLSDQRALRILTGYHGIEARQITIEYGNPQSITQPALLVDREYLRTPQAQYTIHVDDQIRGVHGPFPVEELEATTRLIVYHSGEQRLQLIDSS